MSCTVLDYLGDLVSRVEGWRGVIEVSKVPMLMMRMRREMRGEGGILQSGGGSSLLANAYHQHRPSSDQYHFSD